jgi:hypothetical protein
VTNTPDGRYLPPRRTGETEAEQQPRDDAVVNPPDGDTLWWEIRHGVPPGLAPSGHVQTEAERDQELAARQRPVRAEANWPRRKETTDGNGS